MGITIGGIDVPKTVTQLDFRVMQLELVADLLLKRCTPDPTLKQELAQAEIKAKKLIHKKYPFVRFSD